MPFKNQEYRFLISLLVPELLGFKDSKNNRKNGAKFWETSMKIDKTCDVMSWTSGSKQS